MNLTRRRRTKSDGAPHGREQVREAILAATEKLMMLRSPSEISVREIAAAANVKHPLIYRHFGSKYALFMAATERYIESAKAIAAPISRLDGNVGVLFDTFASNRWRQITMARAMIDGIDPKLIQSQFPVMRRLVELLDDRLRDREIPCNHDPKTLAMALGGLAMGWILFAPFLKASTDSEELTNEEMNVKAVAILEEFVEKIC